MFSISKDEDLNQIGSVISEGKINNISTLSKIRKRRHLPAEKSYSLYEKYHWSWDFKQPRSSFIFSIPSNLNSSSPKLQIYAIFNPSSRHYHLPN